MTRSDAWYIIKDCTKDDPAGKQVTTTALGDVDARMVRGKPFGIVPLDLRIEARQHGFRIVGTSVQDGTYTLEKL